MVFDEGTLAQLSEMGFPLEGCKRAIYHTKNEGVEQAMNWIMEHMADPGKLRFMRKYFHFCFHYSSDYLFIYRIDFGDPFVQPGQEDTRLFANFVPDPFAVESIVGMGFTPEQATKALKNTVNIILKY